MPRYLKKQIPIECNQITEEMVHNKILRNIPFPPEYDGLQVYTSEYNTGLGMVYSCKLSVNTLEGFCMVGRIGDWLMTGVKGEKYFCADDVFRDSYDLYLPKE